MTDISDDIDPQPPLPAVDPLPVAGAEGLPDDVRNGDADPDVEA